MKKTLLRFFKCFILFLYSFTFFKFFSFLGEVMPSLTKTLRFIGVIAYIYSLTVIAILINPRFREKKH